MLKKKILFELKEDLCQLLVENSNDGLFVINGDRIEYCNEAFTLLAGLSERDIDSVSAREFIGSVIKPDERENLERWWSQTLEGYNPDFFGPVQINNHKGRSAHLQLSSTDGPKKRIIGIVRDVSELIESQSRLREKDRILSSLIEQARTPVFIVQNGIIKFVNPAVLDTFGYRPEEVIGTRVAEYLPDEIKESIMTLYQNRLQSPDVSRRLEFSLLHKNGQEVEVDVVFNFIEYEGKPAEIVLTHDITERKRIEARLEETLGKLRKAFGASISILNKIVEIKDPYTGGHQKRVAELARTIATEMKLEPEKIDGLRLAAQIHDIGKIIVPAEILSKPGPLSEIEWGLVKNHVVIGCELLKDIDFPWPIVEIVYQHHERMDGSGYPRGLKGEEIMVEARILAVSDVVEAMSSFRPYREAHSMEEALSEIQNKRGQLYDDKVVEVCLDLFLRKGYRLGGLFLEMSGKA
ncbi:MAG: HD domain-containing phosphohydrolase [Candidatus Saccharicenans sp.]|uniref:HD domain-containing phosphohydrolase n=1 Tax=Candidatus Saccharicenans sp. TaxID=2819258 RepID=UPI00404A4295